MPRKGEVTSSYVHILYIIAFALTQFQFNNITTSAVEGNSIFLSAALFFIKKMISILLIQSVSEKISYL
jgi:hypothetical protein